MTRDGGSRYGKFVSDGRSYSISDPRTPRPWSNIIASPRIGLAISQTGSGFTWIDNSQLAVITGWQQDFARDCSGKFLFLRDLEDDQLCSLAPAPVWAPWDEFECCHRIGSTTFRTVRAGLATEWTLWVDLERTVEFWRVRISNRSRRVRRFELTSFFEWCCGVAPAPRREFHKLFIETDFDRQHGIAHGTNRMWDIGSARWGHWNTDFPYAVAFGSSQPIRDALGDKSRFLGRYGNLCRPQALHEKDWPQTFGRHEDPIAALRSELQLLPDDACELVYVLAIGSTRAEAETLVLSERSSARAEQSLRHVENGWDELLSAQRIETPEPLFNAFVNDWVRYQAISARLWGRCGYYQQSGAFGFRDQLQDAQLFLTIDPQRCRDQIELHARHQFADGSVYHWWHPLSEHGHVTKMTDDLLWLAFVTANYIKETGEYGILADPAPFIDDPRATSLSDHVQRAFRRVFARTSARGIPFIGAGDWNDGLSAAGLLERGESFWLGHFLAGLLRDWAEIAKRCGSSAEAEEYLERRDRLIVALNQHGWDGDWYARGTLDDGSLFGSHGNQQGKIYLNAQTWAVLADVAPPDRAAKCLDAVERHLVSDAGALLLAPAYDRPVQEIGYITRYAPGLRENGGVYTHAATWAIAAACKAKRAALAARLLFAIDPTGKDPDRYLAEPYVLPGNVDGPASPYPGRAGWTWYTGSAAWYHRVVCEWVLGIRPEWAGLRIDPCLPPQWNQARMLRPWRGHRWRIEIVRDRKHPAGAAPEIRVGGEILAGDLIPPPSGPAREQVVEVRIG